MAGGSESKSSNKMCDLLKCVLSSVLLGLSAYAIILGVSLNYCSLFDEEMSIGKWETVINASILTFVCILLFINEGFQVALLSAQPLNIETDFKQFPRAAKCHELLFPVKNGIKDSNMKRLFIGQSFLVVLSTFLMAKITHFRKFDAFWAFNSEWFAAYLGSVFQGIFFTICVLQLFPSIIGKNYPREFLNLPLVFSTIKLALLIESLGIVQFTYLLVYSAERAVFKEPSKSSMNNAMMEIQDKKEEGFYFYLSLFKYTCSTILTIAALAFLLFCISSNYSSFAGPVALQFVLLLVAMILIFYCEGLKVAIVSNQQNFAHQTQNLLATPLTDESESVKLAKDGFVLISESSILRLLGSTDNGIERYLLGRQQTVVPLGFLIASITHFGYYPIGILSPTVDFLLTGFGLPVVIILLQFSQLTPQLLAEKFGSMFLKLPGSMQMVQLALFIELFGITSVVSYFVELIKTWKAPPTAPPTTKEEDEIELSALKTTISNPLRHTW